MENENDELTAEGSPEGNLNTPPEVDGPLTVGDAANLLGRFESEDGGGSSAADPGTSSEVSSTPAAVSPATTTTEDDAAATPESDNHSEKEDDAVSVRFDDDENAAEEDPVDGAWPESAQARVNELTAKRREAEERAQSLEAEVSQLRAATQSKATGLQPTAENPLADVGPEQLHQRYEDAQSVLNWAIANPDGAEVPGKDGETVYRSAEEVAQIRANAERELRIDLPQREQFLRAEAEATQAASTLYPDLFKPGKASDEGFAILERYPDLRKFPNWLTLVGHVQLGERVARGEMTVVRKPGAAKPNPGPAPAPKAKPSAPVSSAQPAKPDPEASRKAAQKRISEGGSLSVREAAALLDQYEAA